MDHYIVGEEGDGDVSEIDEGDRDDGSDDGSPSSTPARPKETGRGATLFFLGLPQVGRRPPLALVLMAPGGQENIRDWISLFLLFLSDFGSFPR